MVLPLYAMAVALTGMPDDIAKAVRLAGLVIPTSGGRWGAPTDRIGVDLIAPVVFLKEQIIAGSILKTGQPERIVGMPEMTGGVGPNEPAYKPVVLSMV